MAIDKSTDNLIIIQYDGYRKGEEYYHCKRTGSWFGYKGVDAHIKVHIMLAHTLTSIARGFGHYISMYSEEQREQAEREKATTKPKKPTNFIPLF